MSQHRLIRASAGTGKTHALTLRYLELLLAAARVEEILASTFTVKAAGEIRDRLLSWLARAVEDSAFRQQLGVQLETEFSAERAHELLADVALSWRRVSITTLDAFFARLCRCFPLELGLPIGWRIGEPHELEALRAQALAEILAADPARIAQSMILLDKGDSPRSIWKQLDDATRELHALYLESDEPAWTEPEPAVPSDWAALARRLDSAAEGQRPSHATVLRQDAAALASPFPDLEAIAAVGLAKKLLAGEATYQRVAIADEVRALYAELFARMRALWLRRRGARTATLFRLLQAYDAQLQRLKLQQRLLDFDDLPRVLAISDLLGQLEELWYRLDARISHVLLDEFQDTSRLQWSVLGRMLADYGSRADKSLFLVGDRKQAIYRWRGAEPEIFAQLAAGAFGGFEQRTLDRSYRSSPAILEAVDHVFGRLDDLASVAEDRATARAWMDDYRAQPTIHAQRPGYVALHCAALSEAPRRMSVARFCARKVAERLEQDPQASIGILTRTREALAILRHEFANLDISVSEEGGTRLTRHAAPQLLLSLIRLADHPSDLIVRFHLLHSPLGESLGLSDAARCEQLAAELRQRLLRDGYGLTLWHYARSLEGSLSARSRANVERLIELGHMFDARPTLRPSEFVRFVESRVVEDRQDSPVRLLTIHASKGLQFGIVFLCDLDTAWAKHAPTVLVHRPDVTQPPTRVRVAADALLRRLDAESAADYAAWRDALLHEEWSLLYVGMTRAEFGLELVVSERPDPRSSASLLLDAFGQLPAAEGRLLLGEPKPQADAPKRPREFDARPVLRLARARGWRALAEDSPSASAAAPGQSAAELLQPRFEPLRRGRALHAALAEIAWAEDGLPDRDDWLRAMSQREPELSPAALAAGLDEFAQFWPRLQDALRRAQYLPLAGELTLWREHAVAWLQDGRLSRGRFDRVVLGFRDGVCHFAHVIDFKSDSGDAPDVLIERYAPQLRRYGEALRARAGMRQAQIRLSLLLAQSGELLDVPEV